MTGQPLPDAPLPGVLAEIEEVAGRPAAIDLALAMGGETLYVPRPGSMQPSHRLVQAVGERAALVICDRFRGDSLEIPMSRRALVRHLSQAGLSPAEIARRLGISKHTVRQYRRTL